MPSAPESSARETRSYWKSQTRTTTVTSVIRYARMRSCKVSLENGLCSESRKTQSRFAAANIFGISAVPS